MGNAPILLVIEDGPLRDRLRGELRRRHRSVISTDPHRPWDALRRSVRPGVVVLEELSSLGFPSSLERMLPWLAECRVPTIVLATPFDALSAPGARVDFVMTPVSFGALLGLVLERVKDAPAEEPVAAWCA